MIHIPDPHETSERRIDRLMDSYVDDRTCMNCGKRVDYELYVCHPTGEGPACCAECAGITEEPK